VCALNAHWFEFIFGNQLGVILGPVLIGCHPYVTRAWIAIAIASTAVSHSGFVFGTMHIDAAHHDLHHEFFRCNYGVIGLCDWLLKTDASVLGFMPDKTEKLRHHRFGKHTNRTFSRMY
jgi:sterol desaturase/sphingolipid hydroxylase (fatty acid hydroxylase superfamily)